LVELKNQKQCAHIPAIWSTALHDTVLKHLILPFITDTYMQQFTTSLELQHDEALQADEEGSTRNTTATQLFDQSIKFHGQLFPYCQNGILSTQIKCNLVTDGNVGIHKCTYSTEAVLLFSSADAARMLGSKVWHPTLYH